VAAWRGEARVGSGDFSGFGGGAAFGWGRSGAPRGCRRPLPPRPRVEIFVDFRPSGGCGRVGEGDEVEEIGWWCWNFFYIFLSFFKNILSGKNLQNYNLAP
jgi:hypothetical protein